MSRKKEPSRPEEELLVLHEKWVQAAQEHLREIVALALLVVLVAAGWSLFQYQRSREESKAAVLYMQALTSHDAKKREALFSELEKRYSHTAAALAARLDLFDEAYNKGDLKQAWAEISTAQKMAKADLKYFVDMGAGYLQEERGHFQEALKSYQKAVEAGVGLERLAWLDLARVSELAGDRAQAIKYYRELVGLTSQGEVQNFVAVKLARLTAEPAQNPQEGKQK